MKKSLILLLMAMILVLPGCAQDEAEATVIDTPEDMETMIAPMDAIMMYAAERGLQYDAEDPAVFWRLMYYYIGNHGSEHSLAKEDNGILQLDRRAVQEFAAAMFADYDDLMDIPEELSDSVSYDEGMDAYDFSPGDRGLSQSEITGCVKNEDGSYAVTARLYDITDDTTIYAARFKLVENQYVSGIENPLFLYSIESVEEVVEE